MSNTNTLLELTSGKLAGCLRLKLNEGLCVFPKAIYELADTLEILDLSGNQLSDLPDDFHRLHKLKILFLSDNLFEHVPCVLAQCQNLEMIGFKANKIKYLAEGALPLKTRWLILTDNHLSSLPNSMGSLTKLQKCMLAGNQLESLPESMASCQALELLRISANKLGALPSCLYQLPKLSWLAFSGNQFNAQPQNQSSKLLPVLGLEDLTLGEQLGEGASGNIYYAHACTERAIALLGEQGLAVKIFKGAVTSDGYPADELSASLRTASVPNVVRVIAQLQDESQNGLIMNLIPKGFDVLGGPPSFSSCTRDVLSEDKKMPLKHVISIALNITEAVSTLHSLGVLHGDLYAHNILVNDKGDALLSDFGAASVYDKNTLNNAEVILRMDVRALGCFFEDLLMLLNNGETCAKLSELSRGCMNINSEVACVSEFMDDVVKDLNAMNDEP